MSKIIVGSKQTNIKVGCMLPGWCIWSDVSRSAVYALVLLSTLNNIQTCKLGLLFACLAYNISCSSELML